MDTLGTIVALAQHCRTVRIVYQKPAEKKAGVRIVEPYNLLNSGINLMVHCWQVRPDIEDGAAWRCFRVDRIKEVSDGGMEFRPRRNITLSAGQVDTFMGFYREQDIEGPAEQYRVFLERAFLDGRIDGDEFNNALTLSQDLAPPVIRGVHARIYESVLHETLLDGEVSDEEQAYLKGVRSALEALGWAP